MCQTSRSGFPSLQNTPSTKAPPSSYTISPFHIALLPLYPLALIRRCRGSKLFLSVRAMRVSCIRRLMQLFTGRCIRFFPPALHRNLPSAPETAPPDFPDAFIQGSQTARWKGGYKQVYIYLMLGSTLRVIRRADNRHRQDCRRRKHRQHCQINRCIRAACFIDGVGYR